MKNEQQLNPRKFMEMAIEVMRQSVPEPRKDGKASPKVGAVLVAISYSRCPEHGRKEGLGVSCFEDSLYESGIRRTYWGR